MFLSEALYLFESRNNAFFARCARDDFLSLNLDAKLSQERIIFLSEFFNH